MVLHVINVIAPSNVFEGESAVVVLAAERDSIRFGPDLSRVGAASSWFLLARSICGTVRCLHLVFFFSYEQAHARGTICGKLAQLMIVSHIGSKLN